MKDPNVNVFTIAHILGLVGVKAIMKVLQRESQFPSTDKIINFGNVDIEAAVNAPADRPVYFNLFSDNEDLKMLIVYVPGSLIPVYHSKLINLSVPKEFTGFKKCIEMENYNLYFFPTALYGKNNIQKALAKSIKNLFAGETGENDPFQDAFEEPAESAESGDSDIFQDTSESGKTGETEENEEVSSDLFWDDVLSASLVTEERLEDLPMEGFGNSFEDKAESEGVGMPDFDSEETEGEGIDMPDFS